MSEKEFEREPIAGLPEVPPPEEQILWQGSPSWPIVARRIMHIDLVAAYFALILIWHNSTAWSAGLSASDLALSLLPSFALAIAAVGVLALLSWCVARTTIYTITNRRVVMRFGVALPITYNIPFSRIKAASTLDVGLGRGDIALELADGDRIAYLVLWPHVRPWRIKAPQPSLRALSNIDQVRAVLAGALCNADSGAPPVIPPVRAKTSNQIELAARPTLMAAE